MTGSIVDADVLSWVGKVVRHDPAPPVTLVDVQRYAVAVGDHDPVYFSQGAAEKAGYDAVPAPMGYIYWAAHAWSHPVPLDRLRPDGTPDYDDPLRPPIRLQRVIRGGDEYSFHRRLFVGDSVVLERTITDIEEKQGRSGLLVMVVEECKYSTSNDELIATQRVTRVYR